MANIRVNVNYTIQNGSEIVFRSPVDCTAITGLIVYYLREDGNTTSKRFVLADAHGENVGDIPHLFAENAVVKVILDVASGMAFVQNADTNAYLEGRYAELQDDIESHDDRLTEMKAEIENHTDRFTELQAEIEKNDGRFTELQGEIENLEGRYEDLQAEIKNPTGVNVEAAAPGHMLMVKTVDENGKPTEWETIDLLRNGEEIFPETYMSEDSVDGEYYLEEESFFFNMPIALEPGKTYTVTINGKEYTATAVRYDYEGYHSVELIVNDVFDIHYDQEGAWGYDYNTAFSCEECKGDPDLNHGGMRQWIPATLGIYCDRTLIFKEYLPENAPGIGYWDGMETAYLFDISTPLIEGRTYTFSVDGEKYTAVATKNDQNGDIRVFPVDGKWFGVLYNPNGALGVMDENAAFYPFEVVKEGDYGIWEPVTLEIRSDSGETVKLAPQYLDMSAIKADLPTVDMIATFADGTTATYQLYGKAVTE